MTTAVNQFLTIVFLIIALFTAGLSYYNLSQFRENRYNEPDEYDETTIEKESAIEGYSVKAFYQFVDSEKLHYMYFLSFLRKIYFSLVVILFQSNVIA